MHRYMNLIGSYDPCYDPTIYVFPINDLVKRDLFRRL